MPNNITKPKLKPARTITKEKVQAAKDKMTDVSSSVVSTQNGAVPSADSSEQVDESDVIVPVCQPGTESADMPESHNREEAKRKAREESRRKQEESGIDVITPENALVKCTGFMNDILTGYNLYKKHESAIDKQQTKSKEIADTQNETVKRLETVIGRIEDVQGVKAPKRPPFPSWACLAYLFWHWPMYGFAYLWQSKYFRRFCFLIAFFVMVMEFCLIVVLALDNKSLHLDHAKYVTVRNWSYVMKDTAAVNRFNKVDLLFEDVKFNREQIDELDEFIRTKHEKNQKRRK